MNNKWKSRQSGRIITVIGDEIENKKKYRFFVFDDHPDDLCQWDLIYGPPWEEHFFSVNPA